jgi:hypothetical protein
VPRVLDAAVHDRLPQAAGAIPVLGASLRQSPCTLAATIAAAVHDGRE